MNPLQQKCCKGFFIYPMFTVWAMRARHLSIFCK